MPSTAIIVYNTLFQVYPFDSTELTVLQVGARVTCRRNVRQIQSRKHASNAMKLGIWCVSWIFTFQTRILKILFSPRIARRHQRRLLSATRAVARSAIDAASQDTSLACALKQAAVATTLRLIAGPKRLGLSHVPLLCRVQFEWLSLTQRSSFTCHGVGHLSRDCVQGPKCYNCNGVVSRSALCSGPVCIQSVLQGHLSKDCSQPQRRACYTCGAEG